jgi:hypothetical protein
VVAELALSSPGFRSWVVHIGFMVDAVAQGLGFLITLISFGYFTSVQHHLEALIIVSTVTRL